MSGKRLFTQVSILLLLLLIPCRSFIKTTGKISFVSSNKYRIDPLTIFVSVVKDGDRPVPITETNVNDRTGIVISNNGAEAIEEDKSLDNIKMNESKQSMSESAFSILTSRVVSCILKSDIKRLLCNDGASTGWTSWIDESSERSLRSCMDDISLLSSSSFNDDVKTSFVLEHQDEIGRWLRWMKASPAPLVIELSSQFRETASQYIKDIDLIEVDSTREELLDRMGCRLILFPSGQTLNRPFQTPTGGMAFGKLLYGGVTRFRLLKGGKRRTGERTAIMSQENERLPCWVQYGGPERKYEALDMGPAAVLEIIIVPKGLLVSDSMLETGGVDEMNLSRLSFPVESMITFLPKEEESSKISNITSMTLEQNISKKVPESSRALFEAFGKERNDSFQSSFVSKVGGLQPQIQTIIRRVLDGRIIYPHSNELHDIQATEPSAALIKEANELAALGLNPVRGLLLYGKPGVGKTALVREIAHALQARSPQIVAAPELLDRWVGGSERLVRELFQPAEMELKACNGDASKSALHIIVIDEIDAIFRKRRISDDSGDATRNSVVNQILAKMDGVNVLSNVLVIGMTNQRGLLDEALLRPGRLEVQIEIPVPDREGRREILQIHFDALRKRGRLTKPLCQAIDGKKYISTQDRGNKRLWRRTFGKIGRIVPLNTPLYDLAADHITGGFTGADIAGLVRCAGSIALSRCRINGSGIESLEITLDDVKEALSEVQQ